MTVRVVTGFMEVKINHKRFLLDLILITLSSTAREVSAE